jgi:hypothetical protein
LYNYHVSGLSLMSDLELTGFGATAAPAGPADVVIRAAPVPLALADPIRTGPNWAMAPGAFLLRVPGVVRFLLQVGRRIDYEAETGAAPGDVAAFAMGGALGILLQQRGLIVLNAASVVVDGRAMVFMGGSGAGKSTLAAGLEARGYPVVADDLCCIGMGPGGWPRLVGDGAQLKLWDAAIEALGLDARRGPPVRAALRKFHLHRAALTPGEAALSVGRVYAVREARAPFAPGITQPNIVDANLLVRRWAYRAPLVDLMDQAGAYFAAAVAFGNGGGVYLLSMPAGFDALGGALDDLERHWSGHGALAGAA